MNLKLIETLLITLLLPLFAVTSAAKVSAAGPMLRNLELEEEAVAISGSPDGKKSCDADPADLIIRYYALEIYEALATKAGLSSARDPGCGFSESEINALKALIGSNLWECISNACSYNGSAQLQVTTTCVVDGLNDFFQGTEVEVLREILQLYKPVDDRIEV